MLDFEGRRIEPVRRDDISGEWVGNYLSSNSSRGHWVVNGVLHDRAAQDVGPEPTASEDRAEIAVAHVGGRYSNVGKSGVPLPVLLQTEEEEGFVVAVI